MICVSDIAFTPAVDWYPEFRYTLWQQIEFQDNNGTTQAGFFLYLPPRILQTPLPQATFLVSP